MKFSLNGLDGKVFVNSPENIKDNCVFVVEPDRTYGLLSERIIISFEAVDERGESREGTVCIELNRNHALYLRNFIDAFLSENNIQEK